MAAELMVINPVRRRKRRPMTAKQRKYFGSSRRKRKSPRRHSYARRNPVASVAATPIRRRRRSRGRLRARARSYYRSRSGGRGIGGFLGHTLVPAAIGGGGAFLLDMAWDQLPLPDMLKTGVAAPLARIGLAVGVGWAVGMVAGKKYGNEAMAGALAVTAYDLIKNYVVPSIPVAAVPAVASQGAGVGYFADDGLGYWSSAKSAGRGMGLFV